MSPAAHARGAGGLGDDPEGAPRSPERRGPRLHLGVDVGPLGISPWTAGARGPWAKGRSAGKPEAEAAVLAEQKAGGVQRPDEPEDRGKGGRVGLFPSSSTIHSKEARKCGLNS